MAAPPLLDRLSKIVQKTLGRPDGLGADADQRTAKAAGKTAESVGILGVGMHSDDDTLAEWAEKLWHDQDALVAEYAKEWTLHLIYCQNLHAQSIAYHRGQGRWVRRPTAPGRIRSTYNVCQKAVNIRTQRLVENKPAVTVQALTAAQADVDKAELKEQLWWSLYTKLAVHGQITKARRWASKTGSGFLKAGWDPFKGEVEYATRREPRFGVEPDPLTGQPIEKLLRVEEVYIDEAGKSLGPTTKVTPDPDRPGESLTENLDPPPGTATYQDGEAFLDVRSPFNIRWDRYTDELPDSWYVQDGQVMATSAILGLWPKSAAILKEAKAAGQEHKALQWNGLQPRAVSDDVGTVIKSANSRDGTNGAEQLERDYFVLETWIWPKNDFLRRLWGPKGARLITVGGKLITKPQALPAWALKACPFVQFRDLDEEGNHYARAFLRDLIPIQDDINRSRSQIAEGIALRERLLLAAPQNHQMRVSTLGGMSGAVVTYRGDVPPQVLSLGQVGQQVTNFYADSLAAAADLGNMNDASTGKLPSAGIAAKAVYALQYAEEKSIAEVSTMQDTALARLARALDAITREEYTEARKIKVTGEDRAYLQEFEVGPEHLSFEVDYQFVPGSMLSRQKEALKNELIELKREGLVDAETVRRFLPTGLPDVFRQSFDLQYSKARRHLWKLRKGEALPAPDPWDDPVVNLRVLEEAMLSHTFDLLSDQAKVAIQQRWEAFRMLIAQQQQPQAAPPSGQPADPNAPGAEIGGVPGTSMPVGAEALAEQAASAMEPPVPV